MSQTINLALNILTRGKKAGKQVDNGLASLPNDPDLASGLCLGSVGNLGL